MVHFEVSDQGPGVPPERADQHLHLRRLHAARRRGHRPASRRAVSRALAGASCSLARPARAPASARLAARPPRAPAHTPARRPCARSTARASSSSKTTPPCSRSSSSRSRRAACRCSAPARWRSWRAITSRGAILDAALVDLSPIAADVGGALAAAPSREPRRPRRSSSAAPRSACPDALQGEFAAWVRKPFEMGEVLETLQDVSLVDPAEWVVPVRRGKRPGFARSA